jgi:hypothetical protein
MDIEDIKVTKVETRKPVHKDGMWQIHQETIEYTDDQEPKEETIKT